MGRGMGLAVAMLVIAACSAGPPSAVDAGAPPTDAGAQALVDAAPESQPDVSLDAGRDLTPPPPDLPITMVHPMVVVDPPTSAVPDVGSSPCGWLGPDQIRQVVFTPDGKSIATSGGGGLRFYDARTGAPVRAIAVDQDLRAITFSADGTLVAGGVGTSARVWRVRDGTLVFNGVSAPPAAFYPNGPAALSPDGTLLAIGAGGADSDGVALFDVATGQFVRGLSFGAKGFAAGLAFSPGGDYLAVGFDTGLVMLQLWSMQTFAPVAQLDWNASFGDLSFAALVFSPDGRLLSGGERIMTVPSLATFANGAANPAAFSPDSKLFAAAGGSSVSIWTITATGLEVREGITLPHPAQLAAFSPDGGTLAAAASYALSVHDLLTDEVTWSSVGNSGTAVAVDHGFVSLSSDAQLGRWSARGQRQSVSQAPVRVGKLSNEPTVQAFSLSPDGRWLAAYVAGPGARAVSLQPPGAILDVAAAFAGNGVPIPFSPAGDAILDATAAGTTEVDVATNQPVHRFPKPSLGGAQSVYSRDGTLVFVGGDSLDVWRRADATLLRRVARDSYPPPAERSLAIVPSSDLLVACESLGTLSVWDTATWTILRTVKAHTRDCSVAVSPDGARLVTTANDGLVRFWRTADLALLATMEGTTTLGWMLGLAADSDGTDVAAVQTYNAAYLYCLAR